MPPSDLGNQLGMLQECTIGTDIPYVVSGEIFYAHRAILACRSPVFKAELLGSMAEVTMPSITVHEIEPAIFRIMLRFIYTDAVPGNDVLCDSPFKILSSLLAAADRYALDRLKLWCAKKVWDGVTAQTVSVMLLLADKHSCLELKERCIELMVRKEAVYSFYLTNSFLQLVQSYPHLVAELQQRRRRM